MKQNEGREWGLPRSTAILAALLCVFLATQCYRLGIDDSRDSATASDADADGDVAADGDEDGDDEPDGDEDDGDIEEPECTRADDCDDGDLCTVSTCTDLGRCVHGFASAGTPCGSDEDTECTDPDICDGAGGCRPENVGEGAPCGDQNLPCHIDDRCDDSGRCVDNGFAADGVQCADDSFCNGFEVCDGDGRCLRGTDPCPSLTCEEAGRRCVGCVADAECPVCYQCDTSGGDCVPQSLGEDLREDCPALRCRTGSCDGEGWCGYEPEEQSCGDLFDLECSRPDTCDGAGTCLANHQAVDTPCGDGGTECQPQDICDGAGECQDVGFTEAGAPCGEDAEEPCSHADTCDGDGVCLANDVPDYDACDDSDPCTMTEQCKDGTCVGEPTDIDDDGFTPIACGGDDCDDDRYRVHPDAREMLTAVDTCSDGIDNDCDGAFDADDPGCGVLCPGLCDTNADCVDCGAAEWCHPTRGCCALCTEEDCPCALPI